MTADAPYLDADAAQARDPRLVGLTEGEITAGVAGFEEIVERACDVAFTPRTRTLALARRCRLAPFGTPALRLPDVAVSSITEVKVDGVTQSGPTTGTIYPDPLGDVLTLGAGWSTGLTDVSTKVTYVHGLAAPPASVLDACTEYVLAVSRSRQSGHSRNTLTEATEAGTTRYSTPDFDAGRWTGFLEVDRLIDTARKATEQYRPSLVVS